MEEKFGMFIIKYKISYIYLEGNNIGIDGFMVFKNQLMQILKFLLISSDDMVLCVEIKSQINITKAYFSYIK